MCNGFLFATFLCESRVENILQMSLLRGEANQGFFCSNKSMSLLAHCVQKFCSWAAGSEKMLLSQKNVISHFPLAAAAASPAVLKMQSFILPHDS